MTDTKISSADVRLVKAAERDAASAIDELKAARRDGADAKALIESATQRFENAVAALKKLPSASAKG